MDITNLKFTAISAAIGVAFGVGVFKGTVKQIQTDLQKEIEVIKKRQARLRGEANGDTSTLYMTRLDCEKERASCSGATNNQIGRLCRDLDEHTKSIRALDNFARWKMQKEGLKIEEINMILGS